MSTRVTFVAVLLATPLAAQAGWSVPVLEPALNALQSDTGPCLTADGLSLFFASFRPNASATNHWEIWSSTRAAIGAPWSLPVQEIALGGPGTDDQPSLTVDALEVYFGRFETGVTQSFDILRATRASTGSPWNPPVAVAELNSAGADSAPSVTGDGLEVFFLSTGWGNPSGANNSIFVATRASASLPFGTPALVSEFSNANTHRDVEIGLDGLTIVFTEYVQPRLRVMYSERLSRTSPWAPPVAWTEFDTVGTSQGVFGFTRSLGGGEAYLAAGFAAAAGSQELMRTTFTGLTHQGAAGLGATMSLGYHDPLNPGRFFAIGAALGNTGFPLGARTVPLDPDWLLLGTLGVSVPGHTAGWGGLLDGQGEAVATLTNGTPALTGLVFWVGGLTWDNGQPFGVGTITNSFAVQFQ